MLNITKENFNSEIAEADNLVAVDFWAAWCGPCKMLAPVFEQLSNEMENVKFCKVNVDEQPELARQFAISSIPAIVLIKDGMVIDTLVGYRPKEALAEAIKEYAD